MASVSDLLLAQGRSRADAMRRQGEISANKYAQLAGIAGQTIQGIAQHQADAPRRELESMQLDQARGSKAAAEREAQEESGLRQLFATSEHPDPKAIMAIVGPERGTKIVTALSALSDTNMQRFKSQQEIVAATLAGLDAIPENLRKDVYGGIRHNLIGRKIIGEQDAPEQYDAQWFQQARNFGQKPASPESKVVGADAALVGPDGKVLYQAPAKPEKLTFGAPTPAMVGGRRVFIRTGSDGQTYDMRGQKIDTEAAPIAPERSAEPLEAIVGPNGQPVLVPRSQAVGQMPATNREKSTEDERKTTGFYKQMRDAIATIDELEDQITEKELYQIQSLPQEQLIGMANRNQLSEAAKRYLRAFNQFTESRLRPVSGAAIADSEYVRDRQTYAKQYGETPKLKEDRSRARNLALESLGDRAGVLKPKDNEDAAPPQVLAAGPGEHTFANGQTWKVSADGKTAKRIK